MSRDGGSIDHRLLTAVMHNPHSALKSAVSMGLAIGTELAKRKQMPLLSRLIADKGLHDSVIAAALEQWADIAKEGIFTETQFARLCDRIVGIASAS